LLHETIAAIQSDEPLEKRFSIRNERADLCCRDYLPDDVKSEDTLTIVVYMATEIARMA